MSNNLEIANPPYSGQEFTVDPADLVVPVLCYPFPEVRQLLGSLSLDQMFHMSTLTPAQAREMLYDGGYSFYDDLEIPVTVSGRVNFEEIHEPVAARITEYHQSDLPGLSDFANRYTTAGSTEAMKSLMASWIARGKMTELGVVQGEYSGYSFIAAGLGITEGKTHRVPSLAEAGSPVNGRVWFVSNPSAVDGNWHDDDVLQNFIESGHEVVIDYAYGGLTPDQHTTDVSAPNVTLVASPSKMFGVFNHRYTGVAYTQEAELALMDTTTWFRGVEALMNTLMLYKTFKPHELPRKYQTQQRVICEALGRQAGKEIKPSDNILMAHANEALPDEFAASITAPGKHGLRLSTFFQQLEQYERIQAQS